MYVSSMQYRDVRLTEIVQGKKTQKNNFLSRFTIKTNKLNELTVDTDLIFLL